MCTGNDMCMVLIACFVQVQKFIDGGGGGVALLLWLYFDVTNGICYGKFVPKQVIFLGVFYKVATLCLSKLKVRLKKLVV